jgi:hypothetical protein
MKKLENISIMVTDRRYFSALFHKMREGRQKSALQNVVGESGHLQDRGGGRIELNWLLGILVLRI